MSAANLVWDKRAPIRILVTGDFMARLARAKGSDRVAFGMVCRLPQCVQGQGGNLDAYCYPVNYTAMSYKNKIALGNALAAMKAAHPKPDYLGMPTPNPAYSGIFRYLSLLLARL